MESKTICGIL